MGTDAMRGLSSVGIGNIGFRGRNNSDKDLAVLSQRPFTTSCRLEGLRLDAKGGGSC